MKKGGICFMWKEQNSNTYTAEETEKKAAIKWQLIDTVVPIVKETKQFPNIEIDDDKYTYKQHRTKIGKHLIANIETKEIPIKESFIDKLYKLKRSFLNINFKSLSQTFSQDLLGIQVDEELDDDEFIIEGITNELYYMMHKLIFDREPNQQPDENRMVIKKIIADMYSQVSDKVGQMKDEELKQYLADILAHNVTGLDKKDKQQEIERVVTRFLIFITARKVAVEEMEAEKRKNTMKIETNPFHKLTVQRITLDGKVKRFKITAPNPVYWTYKRITSWERKYKFYQLISPQTVKFLKVTTASIFGTIGVWLTLVWFVIHPLVGRWFEGFGAASPLSGNSVFYYRPLFFLPSYTSKFHFWVEFTINMLILLLLIGLIVKFVKQSVQLTGPSATGLYIEKLLMRKDKKYGMQLFSIPQYSYDGSLSHTLVWGRTGTGKTATILVPTIVDRAVRDGIVFFFDPKFDSRGLYPLYRHIFPFSLNTPDGYSINLFNFLNIDNVVTDQDYLKLGDKMINISSGNSEQDKFWNMSANQRVILPLLKFSNENIGIPFGWTGLLFDLISNQLPDLGYIIFDKDIADTIAGKGAGDTTQSIIAVAKTPISALLDGNVISLFSSSVLNYELMTLPSTFMPIGWDASKQDTPATQLAASLMFYIIDRTVTHRFFKAQMEGISIKKLPPITVIIDELQNLPKIEELATFVTLYRGYGVQLIFSIQAFSGLVSKKKYDEKEGLNIVANAPMKILLPQGTEEEEFSKMLNSLIADFLFINYSVGSQDSVSEQKMEVATERVISSLKRDAAKNVFTPLVIEQAPTHAAVSIVLSRYIPEIKSYSEKVSRETFKFPRRKEVNNKVMENIKIEILSRVGL